MIYDLSWSPGIIAILLYIKGMFHLIPRLTFDHFTSHNLSSSKKSTKIWIPKGQSVIFIFWSISISIIFSLLIFSLLKGYFYYRKEKLKIFIILFLYYGGILINLMKNCLFLTEESSFDNDRNHLSFIS